MSHTKASPRDLPSIDRLLTHSRSDAWLARYDRAYLAALCRGVLGDLRQEISRGAIVSHADLDESAILDRVEQRLKKGADSRLVRVVNATGTVLHTNLGRALLPQSAIDAMCLVAGHAANVEYDVARGMRGKREELVEPLLVSLTGAESATVVNNNAAAVLVAVNSLAAGKEVVVSRGELIEIGGAFRIPEIIEKTGARLREVGTTNRTHAADYERAIGPETGLVLKVHTSNYRIVGFSADVELGELVAIGRRHSVPVMVDLGSGALVDLSRYGLPREPLVADQISAGADVVTFSGDKILGGPQAGLIVGSRAAISRIAQNPLHRAVRCGKLTIAALDATLRLYQQSRDFVHEIPALRMFTRPLAEIDDVGRRALSRIQQALGSTFRVTLEDSTSQVGSGALPTEELPTKALVVQSDGLSAERIAGRFRNANPPIIGRINDDRFLLDLRTIFDPDDVVPHWAATSAIKS
jgi:L-seryl-tRNA(Ser) seleniumtransferase